MYNVQLQGVVSFIVNCRSPLSLSSFPSAWSGPLTSSVFFFCLWRTRPGQTPRTFLQKLHHLGVRRLPLKTTPERKTLVSPEGTLHCRLLTRTNAGVDKPTSEIKIEQIIRFVEWKQPVHGTFYMLPQRFYLNQYGSHDTRTPVCNHRVSTLREVRGVLL